VPAELTQGVPDAVVALGPPLGVLLLLLDSDNGHLAVPGFEHRLLLTPRLLAGPVLQLDAAGRSIWPFTLPPDPWWRNRFLFLQGLTFDAVLRPALTELADARMR
jgi:hypothetical protein